jgi:type III pantothenate kinase
MQLVIDFGNTLAKAALFEGEQMIQLFKNIDHIQLIKLANENINAQIMMSSVNQNATHIINLIENKERITRLDHNTKIPIKNLYLSPETLGMDRLAAAVGANKIFQNHNCLVIDAGTCLTYDYINANSEYLGGSISLGLQMRFRALNQFTSKLPLILVEQIIEPDLIGRKTNEAIVSGVFLGIVNEINGIIDHYHSRFDNLKVLLCGGDHTFFESRIKHPIFAHPELVLLGLNRILLYNAH